MSVADSIRLSTWRALKALLFSTPAYRVFLPITKFDMRVSQWHFMIGELAKVRDVPGCVLEVGVGGGFTSVILSQEMAAARIDKAFNAVDTFSGFLACDIEVEITQRGKSVSNFLGYRGQTRDWYLKTLAAYGCNNVQAYEQSIQDFNLKAIEPVSFCLLDVDLYAPTKEALPRIYDALAPGGVLIVDDCNPAISIFDGAGQAYEEFCAERGFVREVVEGKLGVLRKPPCS